MRLASRRLLCALVLLLALLGDASAEVEPAGKRDHGKQPEQLSWPNAWTWITERPQLSSIAGILTLLGADQQLRGPFTGTLLLPTNEAVAAYATQLKVPLEIADTDARQGYWKLFFGKLVNYHVLLRRVYASQWEASRQHTTRYFSSNGSPHRVSFVANSNCTVVPPHRAAAGGNSTRKTRVAKDAATQEACRSAAVQDEQGNNATFARWRTNVQGGGIIYTINAVLQPNDIFPSLTAALSSPDFSTLNSVLQHITACLNITVLDDLETSPGTMAAPLNEAFAGLDVSSLNASALLSVVMFHFCPNTQPWKLVYTPFTFPSLRNPCITLLGRTTNQPVLQLTFKQSNAALPETPQRWISYPTDATVGGNTVQVNSTAGIAMADITVPLHVVHVVKKLLLPPS